jgi:hypothetical protein
MSVQSDVRKIVSCLDQIISILDADKNKITIGDEMQTIVTIPDLFNLDRLQESVIYLTAFYNLD